jgi:hypothetical protein
MCRNFVFHAFSDVDVKHSVTPCRWEKTPVRDQEPTGSCQTAAVGQLEWLNGSDDFN